MTAAAATDQAGRVVRGRRQREAAGGEIVARDEGQDRKIRLRHHLSPRQVDVLLAGGLI